MKRCVETWWRSAATWFIGGKLNRSLVAVFTVQAAARVARSKLLIRLASANGSDRDVAAAKA
jgi:hypothetical protein